MKKLTYLMALAISVSVCTFSSSAEIINADWLDTGDNLTIKDTSTNMEFLKLSQTKGKSLSQMVPLLQTTYLGWRFATVTEVTSMLNNLLADYGGYTESVGQSYSQGGPNATDVGLLVGGNSNSSSIYSMGFVYNSSGYTTIYGFRGFVSDVRHINYYEFSNNAYDLDYFHNNIGTWLVRGTPIAENVSVPLAISGLALLGFGIARRRKQNNNTKRQ